MLLFSLVFGKETFSDKTRKNSAFGGKMGFVHFDAPTSSTAITFSVPMHRFINRHLFHSNTAIPNHRHRQ